VFICESAVVGVADFFGFFLLFRRFLAVKKQRASHEAEIFLL